MRLKNICFTLFNYTDKQLDAIYKSEKICYVICGFEVCASSGRPHIQGYMESFDSISLKQIKEILGSNTAHIEPRYGSQKQAIDYCKKDGKFTEIGEPRITNQGARSDIKKLVKLFEQGHTQYDIVTDAENLDVALNMQTVKLLDKLESYADTPRTGNDSIEVHWFYGPAGTGKTRTAFDLCTSSLEPFYLKSNTTGKWFDGYKGEKIVILDDIRNKYYPFTHLLSLLDRYPCRVETKGASRNFRATKIYITSPYHPRKFASQYNHGDDGHREDPEQLLRRITEIKKFD